MKRIELIITFDDDGNPSIDVSGATGGECTTLTKPIEDALGVVGDRVLKPEYRQVERIFKREVQR